MIWQAVLRINDPLFHFRLCSVPNESEPALGWVLSEQSEKSMREQLRTADCTNAPQFDLLAKRLAEVHP
jgi:hypothetical protein